MTQTILIVDDETSIREVLRGSLEDEGYHVLCTGSAEETQAMITEKSPVIDAGLIDIWMPGMDGLTLLDWLHLKEEEFPVIMMSGHGTIETAVKATKKGAYDFIEKPLSLEKLLITLKHALKEKALERENRELKKQTMLDAVEIVGKSPQILQVLAEIEQAAPSDGWVMIKGDNGTGKELVAKQIHLRSKRAKAPFVAVNCAAIPENLIESELFGFEKGAFEGATRSKQGKFEQAQGGTLFLDEIGDMSLKTQAKILRVLEEKQFERVGGQETFHLDLRIITATNKDLQEEIKAGRFREDLFFRLNVIPLEVPPLRSRQGDVADLVQYYLNQIASSTGFPHKQISAEAMQSLERYHWPGNIRELKNIVERMVIMVQEEVIQLKHVPPVVRMAVEEVMQVTSLPALLADAMANFEKQFVTQSLKKTGWNLDQAALVMGVARIDLEEKLMQHQITAPQKT